MQDVLADTSCFITLVIFELPLPQQNDFPLEQFELELSLTGGPCACWNDSFWNFRLGLVFQYLAMFDAWNKEKSPWIKKLSGDVIFIFADTSKIVFLVCY